uniref:Uncharacterized protein n=1 Tax=Arundo donax TaxID=35708 RepID=A0A0A9FXN5_ARUDO
MNLYPLRSCVLIYEGSWILFRLYILAWIPGSNL